jgi:magnesium transporter
MTTALIAGIYGMNFVNMPELQTQNGYFITLAAMGIIAAILAAVFRRIGWF